MTRLYWSSGLLVHLRQSPIFFSPSRQVCELLILRKADLQFSNAKKQTPLHFAAHAGLHDAAACLLETFQTSALEFEDTTGHSPLLYAAKSKVKSIHQYLQGLRTEDKPEHQGEKTQYPDQVVPTVDLQPAQGQGKEPLQTPQTKCPEGHDLIPFESEEDDFLCSVCECEFPMGTVLYGCRACDYDLCRECLAHTVFHSSGKSFVAAFPEMQTFQSFGGTSKSLLQGWVVAAIGLSECTRMSHTDAYCSIEQWHLTMRWNAHPVLSKTRSAVSAGTGEDVREATESEDDSFASQQFFAEEALGGIEEELLRAKYFETMVQIL